MAPTSTSPAAARRSAVLADEDSASTVRITVTIAVAVTVIPIVESRARRPRAGSWRKPSRALAGTRLMPAQSAASRAPTGSASGEGRGAEPREGRTRPASYRRRVCLVRRLGTDTHLMVAYQAYKSKVPKRTRRARVVV